MSHHVEIRSINKTDDNKNGHRSNIEALRAVSCMMVVLLHLNAWLYDINELSGFYRILYTVFNVLTRFAVPCFMLITGTFIFDNAVKKGCRKFYKDAIKKVLLPTILFSMIYVLYGLLKGSLEGVLVFKDLMIDWVKGIPFGHMWYMYMLIGFYFVVPPLCLLREKMGKFAWGICGIGCVILACLLYNGSLIAPIWPLCWIQYVGYFIIGDCISKCLQYEWFANRKTIKLFCVLLAIITFFVMVIYSFICLKSNLVYNFQPQNILTFIFSVSIYSYAISSNGTNNSFIKLIAKHSGYIFFLHGGAVNIIEILMNRLHWQYNHPLLILVTTYWIVLLSCVIVSAGINGTISKLNVKFTNRRKVV